MYLLYLPIFYIFSFIDMDDAMELTLELYTIIDNKLNNLLYRTINDALKENNERKIYGSNMDMNLGEIISDDGIINIKWLSVTKLSSILDKVG